MPSITGKVTTKQKRFFQGLIGAAVVVVVLLALLLTGSLNRVEFWGLDILQRRLPEPQKARADIMIVYIDQKSIDAFRRSWNLGWPWPRDVYARAVTYLHQAGVRAVVFDATFSEPSVFNNDYGDDQALGDAMAESGRVMQTLLFHRAAKESEADREAVQNETAQAAREARNQALERLAARGLDYQGCGDPGDQGGQYPDYCPDTYLDVTMPVAPIEQAAWGLGSITIEPENDGVIRRVRPLFRFPAENGKVYPALSLATYLKLSGTDKVRQSERVLEAAGASIPLDEEGKAVIKWYGPTPRGQGVGSFQEITFAAVIQSALQIEEGRTPLVPPETFKDKTVFIAAKAAALYDNKSTPWGDDRPGVEVHANFLNNLLEQDFLRRASTPTRTAAVILLLIGTLTAAVFGRSVLSGAVLSLGMTALYLALVVWAFRQNIWMDTISPMAGQGAMFILATLVNYYGEGREKSRVRDAFSLYLSPDVVANVIENPELLSLGGSRRVMSCFFSDLAGFTTISESLSPEELVNLLNRYLSLMTKAIMRSGGTVDKFEGDAIMCFWGAPAVQEDHALRACLSALEQQELLAGLRREVLEQGLPELRARMGVNTGPMIVGNMGSEERFDYTVMGDAVNLASRLEGANKPYGTYIMISEATYAEVRDQVEVRELDLLRVKGKLEPIRVYELLSKSGELSPEKKRVVEVYTRGLEMYRNREFVEAENAFQEALSLDPEDGPSKTYLERCLTYQEDPPPPDWDGVFTMTTK